MSRSLAPDAVLEQIPLFSLLSDGKLDALCRAARHCRHARASTIPSSDGGATGVYVLLAGRAKAVIEDGHGRAMTAGVVAASREMVSRVVKAMSKQGLVRKHKRRTVILDWQSMSAACPQ